MDNNNLTLSGLSPKRDRGNKIVQEKKRQIRPSQVHRKNRDRCQQTITPDTQEDLLLAWNVSPHLIPPSSATVLQAERMELMCRCQRQEQQVADLRKLVDEIAKLEQGAPDVSGDANWETQSVCSDLSGVSRHRSAGLFRLGWGWRYSTAGI